MKLADKLPESDQEILARATNTIVAQVGALKSMVDDFSLYSKSSRLTPSSLILNDLVRDVLVLYESMGVEIRTDLQSDMPAMTADPALLRQVLHNLIQNALDALIGVPSPYIAIVTRADGARVHLVVEDGGSGIREEMMTRIFEPYVTTKPKGTGLGLAIVKKIVDEHHGTIAVVNVKPHGVRVEIELPLHYESVTGMFATDTQMKV
jgi:nitrogen fixation/metabolism regulation signal transduction histidine kinase